LDEASISMVDINLLSTPVGLVINPTRFPFRGAKLFSRRTSIPVFTCERPAQAISSSIVVVNKNFDIDYQISGGFYLVALDIRSEFFC
jgi:hypothetical protein